MYFLGCDVSKATLDLDADTGRLKVDNCVDGWRRLVGWAEQHGQAERVNICVVMEATAVYHLPVAAYLSTAGFKVLICNPGRSAEYVRSQNQLNKNDQLDARALRRYGASLEKRHWFQPDTPEISELKSWLGLLVQLDKDILRWQNRLEKATFQYPNLTLRRSIRRQINNHRREKDRTQKAIDELIRSNDQLRRNQQLMCSIKGVGPVVSQQLLPLLYGERFESARQLAAFLGLTPCHKRSGTSLKSPGQLSGRGNPTIRAKLYMPAVSACHHNPELRAFYQGLLARGKTQKQAITAVMRKMVHLCYGVVKHQTPYIPNYAG